MRFFKTKPTQQFNVQVGGVKIKDVAEKIGGLFGETGREIGKAIDDATKNITIKLDDKEE